MSPRKPVATEPQAEVSFEQAIERLEQIVDRLEDGELPLEEALRVFEEGVGLTRRCARELEDAERRIDELVKQGESVLLRPLDAEGTED